MLLEIWPNEAIEWLFLAVTYFNKPVEKKGLSQLSEEVVTGVLAIYMTDVPLATPAFICLNLTAIDNLNG